MTIKRVQTAAGANLTFCGAHMWILTGQINKICMEYNTTHDCTRKEIYMHAHTITRMLWIAFLVQLLYEKYLPIDNRHNTRSQLQSELCKTKWILCVKKWSAPLRYNTKKFFTQTKWIYFCYSTVNNSIYMNATIYIISIKSHTNQSIK